MFDNIPLFSIFSALATFLFAVFIFLSIAGIYVLNKHGINKTFTYSLSLVYGVLFLIISVGFLITLLGR